MHPLNLMINAIAIRCSAKPPRWAVIRDGNIAAVAFKDGEVEMRDLATRIGDSDRYLGYLGQHMVIVSFSVYGAYIAFRGIGFPIRSNDGTIFTAQ